MIHTLEKESANHSPLAKSGLLIVFVNKVLLEQSKASLFYCLWLLMCYNGRAEKLRDDETC